jgi:hypothetical protein
LSTRSGSWSPNSSTDVVLLRTAVVTTRSIFSQRGHNACKSQGGQLTAAIRLTFKWLVLTYTDVKVNSEKSLTSGATKVG